MADADGMVFCIISAGLITGTTIADMKELGLEENSPSDHLQRKWLKIKDCFQSGEAWEVTLPSGNGWVSLRCLAEVQRQQCWFS
jgi:hypothetical protein